MTTEFPSPYLTDVLKMLLLDPRGATAVDLLRTTGRPWDRIAVALDELERHGHVRLLDWYGEERWFSNERLTIADL